MGSIRPHTHLFPNAKAGVIKIAEIRSDSSLSIVGHSLFDV